MIFIGALILVIGFFGLVMALKDDKEEGWSQSRLKFGLSVISLLIVGLVLIIRACYS